MARPKTVAPGDLKKFDRLYRKFCSIKSRCNDVDNRAYGGKGIKCLWESLLEFKRDMEQSYKDHVNSFGESNTTIDRIDSNGDYCKENCRWATRKIQGRNRSTNVLVFFDGEEKTLMEWSEILKINFHTLLSRINILHWTIGEAFTTKIQVRKRY